MASSTASARITSSRGAADTTAGRIYFSAPSAQVRVPVGDLVFPTPPPPHFCSHYTTRGKLSFSGKITPRRRKNYPAAEYLSRAGAGAQKFGKNPKIVAQCRKNTIPNLYTLNRTIPYLYTLNRTIPYLYTLSRTIPYLNALSRTIPYLNALSRTIPYLFTLNRTIPYLNTLSRTIPYLYTLNRTIPYLNTLSRTIPYLNTLSRIIPYLNTLSRTLPYLNTLRKNPNLAQNQILVGSQSELSTKKP